MTTPWYEIAEQDIGVHEIPGPKAHERILELGRSAGIQWYNSDEIHWCAVAVNGWLAEAGYTPTGTAMARSFETSSHFRRLDKPYKGCIATFWRGAKNSGFGHVGLYEKENSKYIYTLGGNQSDQVNVAPNAKSRHTGYWEPVAYGSKVKPEGKKFTAAFIAKIAPHGKPAVTKGLSELLNKYLPKYGITKPRRIAMFLANIMTETGSFDSLEENLNYTSAKRIRQVWPKWFPTVASAKPYVRNPEKLANYVYNRWGNKGNVGFGWKYRGRGFIQTTFVNNYQEVEKITGLPVVKDPDILLDPEQGLIAACIYWKQNKCNEWADKGDYTRVRKIVNGGTHGLSTVRGHYTRLLPLVKDFDLSYAPEKDPRVIGPGAIGIGLSAWQFWQEPLFWSVLFFAAVAVGIYLIKRHKGSDQ